MSAGDYFIDVAGYQCNPETSFDSSESREYWTDERIAQSLEFQYDVYALAAQLAAETSASRVLDLGCGAPGKLGLFFSPNSPEEIALVDQPNTRELAARILPDARFIDADLNQEVPAIDGQRFDLVICADVIEHLGRPDALLASVRNNLAPDGLAVISTPNRDVRRGPGNLRPNNRAHVREWNMVEFRRLLESAGLAVQRHEATPIRRVYGWRDIARRHLGLFKRHPMISGGQVAVCVHQARG